MKLSDIFSLITLVGVVFSILANFTGMVGRRESKAAAEARLEVKLDNIYSKVESIEKKQDSIETTLQNFEGRLSRLEEALKVANNRIKDLEDIQKKHN